MAKQLPEGIEWTRVGRQFKPANTHVQVSAYNDTAGRRSCRLTVPSSLMFASGFKPGGKFIVLQGRMPHQTWLRIEQSDSESGVQWLENKGALNFSIGRFLRPDVIFTESVDAITGKEALYIQLNPKWVS
jgi:hypothetical protein